MRQRHAILILLLGFVGSLSARALAESFDGAESAANSAPSIAILSSSAEKLWIYRDEKSPESQAAKDAILKIPDYKQYFADRLAQSSSPGASFDKIFAILSLLDTEDAAALIAPYLFDFRVTPGNECVGGSVNALSAAFALKKMKLANAPMTDNVAVTSENIIAWQKWAIERKLAPQSARPSVPKWLLELEASGTNQPSKL